jgi:hypothetical protein
MKNAIIVGPPRISGNRIDYAYEVRGAWREAFNAAEPFFVEYSRDVSSVSPGVALVPLFANLLPMAWVYDAEIVAPACDRDFYESIPAFKRGYEAMLPAMSLGGSLRVDVLEDGGSPRPGAAAAFFSGGVDAHSTLVSHAGEKPALITLWGADVKLDDETGWAKVRDHLIEVAGAFGTEWITVKSGLRTFLNEGALNRRISACKDGWWHAFQHGVGLIGHAAPPACAEGYSLVYFASTFSAANPRPTLCASSPDIDNHVRFCGARVHHDGYEYSRQRKVARIAEFVRSTGIPVALRVCWRSRGGLNCCRCEKCWRTILALIAEGEDPRRYGFDYPQPMMRRLWRDLYGKADLPGTVTVYYADIQRRMRETYGASPPDPGLAWVLRSDMRRLGRHPVRRVLRRLYYRLRRA